MEKIVTQFFKTNIFLKAACLIVFIFTIATNQLPEMTSAIVLTFSLLLLLEGLLSLKYPKPSLTSGLKKLWESELSTDEKSKREISIKKGHLLLTLCGIAAAIIIPWYWIFIM